MYEVNNIELDCDTNSGEHDLSNAQKRIWIQQEMNRGLTAYNLPMLITFDFAIDIRALENTLNYIIHRHDAFRVIIKENNGVAKQIIKNRSPVKIIMTDLTSYNNNGILQQYIDDNNSRVFDMAKQMFLFRLYKLRETNYVLYLSFHHIIYDGWSQKIFNREFMLIYNAFVENNCPPQLPEIRKQYLEWVYEQKQWLLTSECAQMEQYWIEEIDKPIPKLELPADFARSKEKSYKGDYVHSSVKGADVLKQIALKNNVSMHVLLLTLYFVLLHKLSGQDDIIVGIPYAERSDKKIENTIGVFINSLPIRISFDKLDGFHDLLNHVNGKNWKARENGKYPFDLLIEKVNPERDIASESIYATLFQYYDLFPMENGSSLFDLCLLCRTNGNNLELRMNYCTDVLKKETVERYAHYYVNLINCILEYGTEVRLSQMEFMDIDEKRQVLCDFNDTATSYDKQTTLNQMFEIQVEKTPNSIAVIYDDNSYTYRQVNEMANRLAHTLRENGVMNGSIVAIMMDRCAELIVGVLAILKAGGAYMPIDTAYPEERIAYIIRDSKTNWVVTQKKHFYKISFEVLILCADNDFNDAEPDNMNCVNDSSSLAYVIYTSGTTGTPKGVLVEHRSVINRLLWMKNAYSLDTDHIFVQKTPYTFDVSVYELFIWFLAGGQICILRPGEEKDPQAIIEAIDRYKITAIHFVPSMLCVFLQYAETFNAGSKLQSLQAIFSSGEALQVHQVELCRRIFRDSPLHLYNLYGPTEASIDVTAYDCFASQNGQNIPIGQPISNVRIYIADKNNNILPIGVVGELCIAGDALARGYLNKPELTREKFEVHPFNRKQNPFRDEKAIYRTGDLARWRDDGNIEYLGRMDHQVKIRGYRIELDDIRSNLLKHEKISEAVVIVNSNEHICAFFVACHKLAPQELQTFLSLLLPEYMIPVRYSQVDHIPLNQNGKIDIKTLSMMQIEQNHKKCTTAVNELQDDIRAIWAELLCIDKYIININDRYFDIGGNSILLIKLHRLLIMKFEVEISILDLFAFNTIEKIEQYIIAKREHHTFDSEGSTDMFRSTEYSEYTASSGALNGSIINGVPAGEKDNDIAVIGMWGEFGSAKNPKQFWESLCEGKDLSRELPRHRIEDIEKFLHIVGTTNRDIEFKQASYIDFIDQFDYSFFGISPKEACLMDPSQKIFLQTVWNAVEDSGYSAKSLAGKNIGIYIGYTDDMLYKQLIEHIDPESISIAIPGNVRSMMGGRIAYLLNLHGPNIVIDTACSSALVAAHSAYRAIQCGDCEMAIVGSTKIFLNPLQKNARFLDGVMSADERTKSYDAQADGFGLGEGTGAIILKSLSKAIADKDNIYAVIKGSAITQDGTSIGITAPNMQAQEEVLRRAWREAGICPDDIDYVEGHGTATALGDAVELQALGNMLKELGGNKNSILGSVKSNIGHLDHAAGIAGFIKLLLMLKNKQIPPTAHFMNPNGIINTEQLPIEINNELLDWNSGNGIRTCCISSFGISGTNCHMVLQEYHSPSEKIENISANLFTLSAKTKEALGSLVKSYIIFLQKETDLLIDEICYTANTGREQYTFRIAIPCTEKTDLLCSIENVFASGYIDKVKAVEEGINKETQEDCEKLVVKWKNGHRHDSGLLHKIGELYCMGADIKWDVFYNNKSKRVSLPVYPFAGTRCWCETIEASICHELVWEEQGFDRQNRENHAMENVVIIGPASKFVNQLSQLTAERKNIIALTEFGEQYNEITGEKRNVTLNEQTLSALEENVNWKQVTHVIYCLPSVTKQSELNNASNSINKINEISDKLENGIYSVFRLMKKMLKQSISKCQFILIGNNTYNISNNEAALHPENAASYGMGRVINLEYPHILCRCIDISLDTEILDLYNEIFFDSNNTFITALRSKKRYTQKMYGKKVSELQSRDVSIRKNGVYVITGGTGELGLKVCQLLFEYQEAHVILISRNQFPPREHWASLTQNNNAKVSLYCADVSNELEMAATMSAIIKEFGRIDGIVHCAGIPGDGFIINKQEAAFREVLSPKVEGTWLLHELTKQYKPGFFIMFSSVTAITGAPGQSDYCAANSYLNAFAEYRNQLGLPTLSITWTKWKDIGMGSNFEVNQGNELFRPINPETALKVLGHIWNSNTANIIVGETNPRFCSVKDGSVMIGQTINNPPEISDGFPFTVESFVDESISLNGRVGECGYMYYEKLIATIWKEALGYDTFNIHDSFFDIGGDSLKLRSVYKHIEDRLPGRTTIVDLFTYSTIFQLARFVDDTNKDNMNMDIGIDSEDDLTTELQDLVSDLKKGTHSIEEIMEIYSNLL